LGKKSQGLYCVSFGMPDSENYIKTETNIRKQPDKFSGFVYCPEVSTDFYLVKRKGVISISG